MKSIILKDGTTIDIDADSTNWEQGKNILALYKRDMVIARFNANNIAGFVSTQNRVKGVEKELTIEDILDGNRVIIEGKKDVCLNETALDNMAIDQAIMQLEYRKDFATKDQIIALDMAINSLKAWKSVKKYLEEEQEFAYADFERYKVECLGQDWDDVYDSLPQDDYRFGMKRAIEIINEHLKGVVK